MEVSFYDQDIKHMSDIDLINQIDALEVTLTHWNKLETLLRPAADRLLYELKSECATRFTEIVMCRLEAEEHE